MNRQLKKVDSSLWNILKGALYLSMMMIFISVLSIDVIGLSRLSRTYGVTMVTFTLSGFLFLQIYGGYDIGRKKSKPIIRSLALAVICSDIITYLQVLIMKTDVPDIYAFRIDHLELLGLAMIIQLVVIVVFTYGGHWLFFRLHEPERCYVITKSQESLDSIIKGIMKFQKQYKIIGVFDYRDPNITNKIKEVDTIFAYDIPPEIMSDILQTCYRDRKNIYFNPNVDDIMEMHAKKYLLDDIYLFNKNVKAITMGQRVIKRVMDIGISFVGGVLSAPVWLIAMLAIKMEDKGPVLFKQERATLNGTVFLVYKLRTMKVDAEIKSATQDDDRVTKVGRVLRKTRIDEIPQLWNVLKGEMSIVGPRPEMLKNVHEYTNFLPEFKYRLRMKGGLTGYAQIAGKYNTPPKDKLIMDMMYIEEFNIWKDIQLIFQTLFILMRMDSTEGFALEPRQTTYKFVPYEEN